MAEAAAAVKDGRTVAEAGVRGFLGRWMSKDRTAEIKSQTDRQMKATWRASEASSTSGA